MTPQDDTYLLKMIGVGILVFYIHSTFSTLSRLDAVLAGLVIAALGTIVTVFAWDRYSKSGRKKQRILGFIKELPEQLLLPSPDAVVLGRDEELGVRVMLPDAVRSKHVHILGATGSGKTESVILNLLRQDVARGIGAIILDAKGDASFLRSLREWVEPSDKRTRYLENLAKMCQDNLPAIQGIVETTLDGSRKIALIRKRENLIATVEDSVALNRSTAELHKVEIKVTAPASLEVDHDPSQVLRVVHNLVKNAIEAASEGVYFGKGSSAFEC